jgi:hypothetical protein
MFFKGSRYENAGAYTTTKLDGTQVSITLIPLPSTQGLLGFHPRQAGQRLDLLGAHYLSDATTFWRLCDANNAVVPDALAARKLIGIPPKR